MVREGKGTDAVRCTVNSGKQWGGGPEDLLMRTKTMIEYMTPHGGKRNRKQNGAWGRAEKRKHITQEIKHISGGTIGEAGSGTKMGGPIIV